MNLDRHLLLSVFLLAFVSACTSNGKKGYNPSEPKCSDLTIGNHHLDSMTTNSLKLTIMSQKPSEDIPLSATQALESKMLSIASKNGIVVYGGNPAYVFAALITLISKDVTSSPPVKYVTKYTLNMYVANIVTGDVYGNYSIEIMGVGKSFELAAVNAMSSIKDNSQIQGMLTTAKEKIVSWYNNHYQQFISDVNDYINKDEYDKAYSLLSSVPEQANVCFEYAQRNKDVVYQRLKKKQGADNYAKMINEIAKAGNDYNPNIGAYLLLLPNDTPEYTRAQKAYEDYLSRITKAAEIASDREFYLEQERLAAQKLELEAHIKTSEALQIQMEQEHSSANGNSIISQIVNQAVQLGVSEIIGFIL